MSMVFAGQNRNEADAGLGLAGHRRQTADRRGGRPAAFRYWRAAFASALESGPSRRALVRVASREPEQIAWPATMNAWRKAYALTAAFATSEADRVQTGWARLAAHRVLHPNA